MTESRRNQLLVIAPYWHAGTWVFDDERVGLEREPFVAEVPEIIDRVVQRAGLDLGQSRRDGIRLLFSADPFPGSQEEASRVRPEAGGWWYRTAEPELDGWLCPALFHYFDEAPERLFVRAEAVTEPSEGGTR